MIAGWTVAFASAAIYLRARKLPKFALPKPSALDAILTAAIAGILAIADYTALVYPPNSADAMAYHLPLA